MPALLHINGPPGVGKSTLAALWVDRHPGAMNLDIDTLLPLVGGWQDAARDIHALLRPSAKAMAAAHLGGGHDVVLPQYLARPDEIDAFAAVARDSAADFVEIILLVDRADAIERFELRPDTTAWHRHNRRMVAEQGGRAFLSGMYDGLLTVAGSRPSAIVIHSRSGEIEETYAELQRAVLGAAAQRRG